MKPSPSGVAVLFLAALALSACSDSVDEDVSLTYDVPLQEGAYWPKFRRTAANTGWTPVKPGFGQDKVWAYKTGKGIFSSPVIDRDGVIYIGSADAYFYAIKPDGSLLWKKKLGELVDSAALVGSDGTIYFGSGDGNLYAVDPKTGKDRWKFQPRGGAFITWFEGNVAMGPDGTLYAGNDDFRLYAVDPKTGKERWSYKVGDQIWSAAAVDKKGVLYFGSNDLSLRAVDLDKAAANPADVGKKALLWSQATLGSVVSSPLVTPAGEVFFGSYDGYIYGNKAAGGQQLFKLPVREHVYASAALAPDGTIYLPSADGTLYALDRKGNIKWSFDTLDPIRSSPAVGGDGTIYFGCGDGRLYAINPDGTRRWSFDTSEDDRNDLNSSPALGKDAVYIAGEDGKVWSVPYDYCLRHGKSDKRCSSRAGEDLPDDGAHVYFLTHGGSSTTSAPSTLGAHETIALRLVVRKAGDFVDAAIDPAALKVTVTPAAKHTLQVAADGSFVVIVPDAALTHGASYTVRMQGDYLVDGMRLGNQVTGGKKGGSFDGSHTIKIAASLAGAPLAPTTAEVPVFDIHRLAAPQPTMMPSYNQIGFDFMHMLMGVLKYDATTGAVLAWVAAAKRSTAGDIVVDPSDAQRILFPLAGVYKDGSLVLSSSSFQVEFGNVSVPMDFMRIGGTLDSAGKDVGGLSVYTATKCGGVEFYGTLLKVAGLCNPKTDQLVVHGTAMLQKAGLGGKQPAGLKVATATLVEATATADGAVTVKLDGTLPSKEHQISVLLLDGAGKPVPVNYSERTKNTVDGAGKITGATLTLKAADKVKKGTVSALVIHDLYPVSTHAL